MLYADASAYYAMNAIWDLASHRDHFKGRGGDQPDALFTEQDTVVLVDNDKQAVHITGMGYAIGHYARWIRRGAVRIEAERATPWYKSRPSATMRGSESCWCHQQCP